MAMPVEQAVVAAGAVARRLASAVRR
jgi:hypothetical protein